MELREFIAATLSQIIEGVQLAQAAECGTNVNAAMAGAQFGGHLVNVGEFGVATRVDFDVSVSAETTGGAGAKLTVFRIGVQGGAGHTAGSANRIAFSVPVRLPDGDTERQNKIVEESQRQLDELQSERSSRRTVV